MSRGMTVAGSIALALFATGSPLSAQFAPTRAGTEFQVNLHTPDQQRYPKVGIDGNGKFVVVWESNLEDGAFEGVFARRFDSAGAPLATEFQVNTYTAGAQRFPAIGMNDGGAFVIAWHDGGLDGFGYGVFARRFDSSGVAQGVQFQVNVVTAGHAIKPAVAIEDNGDFVIAYNAERDGSYYGVFGRRWSSAGTPLAFEFQANTYTVDRQTGGSIDADTDGDFVIAWASQQDPGYGVFAQRFNSAGARLGVELHVNTYVTGFQADAAVSLDADGDFVVVWTSGGIDGSSYAIGAQRYTSTGATVGGELVVNGFVTSVQVLPDVAMDASGDFVIAWTSYVQDGSEQGIFMRRFGPGGIPQSNDTLVNTSTTGTQYFSAVAADRDGDFVVAWMSDHATATFDVFLQRYEVQPLFDIDGNGVFNPLTDGLLILRFGFGFSGSTLITGAIGAGCTRCDAPSITAHLQSFV